MSHEHYFIDVSGYDRVDVYRLIELIGITCPVAQHVFKKAFATGKRGHKDLRRDWQDIADSAARRLEMIEEDRVITARLLEALGGEEAFGQINTFDYRTEAEKGVNDPRTVEGPDVAFEAERHLYFAPECQHRYRFDYEFPSQEGPLGRVFQCEDCRRIKVGGGDE